MGKHLQVNTSDGAVCHIHIPFDSIGSWGLFYYTFHKEPPQIVLVILVAEYPSPKKVNLFNYGRVI